MPDLVRVRNFGPPKYYNKGVFQIGSAMPDPCRDTQPNLYFPVLMRCS